MCLAGIYARVVISPWPLMETEFHGVSSHTGSVKMTESGISVHSEDAIASRITLSMSSGSYSELAMHEMVQRKRKAFMTAPKTSSSRKVEQYVIPAAIE